MTSCSDPSESETVSLDDPPSATTSETASPSSPSTSQGVTTPGKRVPREPRDGEVILGLSDASSRAERMVVDTWVGYWTEVLRMYRDTDPDRDALYRLANDKAASGPLDYVAGMLERGERQRGGFILGAKVSVDGRSATVTGCLRDSTQNVVAKTGKPIEPIIPFVATSDLLVKEGPDWRVVTQVVEEKQDFPFCDYR